MSVQAVDRVDILAARQLRDFGWEPEARYETVRPCSRPFCRGSIVSSWGSAGCILCCRATGDRGPLEVSWTKMLRRASRALKV